MIGSKTEAMARIARETDIQGFAPFPPFMSSNMRDWEREGLIEVVQHGTAAKITDAGRALAKKSMNRR